MSYLNNNSLPAGSRITHDVSNGQNHVIEDSPRPNGEELGSNYLHDSLQDDDYNNANDINNQIDDFEVVEIDV